MGLSIVKVKNVELFNGSFREYIIGYDFVNAKYIVHSYVIDYYTEEQLKDKFNLSESDIDKIAEVFDN